MCDVKYLPIFLLKLSLTFLDSARLLMEDVIYCQRPFGIMKNSAHSFGVVEYITVRTLTYIFISWLPFTHLYTCSPNMRWSSKPSTSVLIAPQKWSRKLGCYSFDYLLNVHFTLLNISFSLLPYLLVIWSCSHKSLGIGIISKIELGHHFMRGGVHFSPLNYYHSN